MENIDIIILTAIVAIAFVIFIVTSIKEFTKMAKTPYKYKKETGFNRAVLFNLITSLLDEKDEQKKKEIKTVIQRTISDMETDGTYFKD